MKSYRVYGDNIVECERFIELFIGAYAKDFIETKYDLKRPLTPAVTIKTSKQDFQFLLFPGYDRWTSSILDEIKSKGGILREAPDVIVSELNQRNEENIIVAIEYCSALAAGNQAWQRHGRAYSLAMAKIPYLFVAEVGGYELDKDRNRKAARLPNPAVPFSYASYAITEEQKIGIFYLRNPEADGQVDLAFDGVYGHDLLETYIFNIFEKIDLSDIQVQVFKRALEAVKAFLSLKNTDGKMTASDWNEFGEHILKGGNTIDFLKCNHPMEWKKKVAQKTSTPTTIELINLCSKLGIGVTAKDLPICCIPASERTAFSQGLNNIFPDLSEDMKKWVSKSGDLVLCFILGFKPRGDDARPDRGLPAFARMFLGDHVDLITYVYGPAKTATWETLKNSPRRLAKQNGLWEVILNLSNAILVGSPTNVNTHTGKKICDSGYLESHWLTSKQAKSQSYQLCEFMPRKVGENDVDTIIHLLFSKIMSEKIFEGMCNPPGGDWSGVSLCNESWNKEFRWLSLPRISGANSIRNDKRPDHVFQLYDTEKIIIAVESKETFKKTEDDIGTCVVSYIDYLVSKMPSASRGLSSTSSEWQIATQKFDCTPFKYASAIAALNTDPEEIKNSTIRCAADFAISVEIQDEFKVALHIYGHSSVGKDIVKAILQHRVKLPDSMSIQEIQ